MGTEPLEGAEGRGEEINGEADKLKVQSDGDEERDSNMGADIEKIDVGQTAGEEEEMEEVLSEDEVLHVRISEVARKSLRSERRSMKDMRNLRIRILPKLNRLTHKDIINDLVVAILNDIDLDLRPEVVVNAIIPPKREDGSEVWHEAIEGRGFVVVLAEIPEMVTNEVSLATLKTPLLLNTGGGERPVEFVGLAIGPRDSDAQMSTRTVFETGRSLASVLSEPAFRLKATQSQSAAEVQAVVDDILDTHKSPDPYQRRGSRMSLASGAASEKAPFCVTPFSGLVDDVKRRLKWWPSDWTEAWDYKAKVLSTGVYLFCIILAPAIAFGELMSDKTESAIGPMEILISQSASGLVFSIFGGCPFVIIMTTGPLTVFIGFLYTLTDQLGISFLPFYAWVGVWNSFWLMLSVMFNLSNHIHYVTAFVDQIFACLVAGIFAFEAIKPTAKHFFWPDKGEEAAGSMGVVLMVGTFIAAVQLMGIRASDLFKKPIREVVSDYGTALAILAMSCLYHLAKVPHVKTLEVPDTVELTQNRTLLVDMSDLPVWAMFMAAGPAFLLFMLFFLDENITSLLSNQKEFKLRKGEAMHLDLFVVAVINLFLGILGLPFLHGALPQSPLHVMQLADQEEYMEHGVLIKRVVKSRETRAAAFLCHVLITIATIVALPALKSIPVPVLYGVFLTMAYQGAKDNPFVERLLLWITELSKYPPTHMVRRLRLRTVYQWTGIQLLCFAVLWGVKSAPSAALGFPFVIVILVAIRHLLLPKFFTKHDMHILEEG